MPMLTSAQRERFISDGYVRLPRLIPAELVASTRETLLRVLAIDPGDPRTWAGKDVTLDQRVVDHTIPCRTAAIEEAARELVGSDFVPALSYSSYLAAQGVDPPLKRGLFPVLVFPTPGPAEYVRPSDGYHIDGKHWTTTWPERFFLVILAYLSDAPVHGGATTVLPGSHRQVFAHWVATGHPGSTVPPELRYADPTPVPGEAGDVILMHYLLVHSATANRSERIRIALNGAVMPDPARPYRRKPGPPSADWTPLDWTLRTDVGIGATVTT